MTHWGEKWFQGFSAYFAYLSATFFWNGWTCHKGVGPQRPKSNLILIFSRYISYLETTWRKYKLRWEHFILSERTSVRFLITGDWVQPFLYVYLSWQRLCDSTCMPNMCKCYMLVIICRWILWCYFILLLFSTGSLTDTLWAIQLQLRISFCHAVTYSLCLFILCS